MASTTHAHMIDETSNHEPREARGLLKHYLRDLVYGTNDGIITTFAIVSGVTGAALQSRIVLILGRESPRRRLFHGREQFPLHSIRRGRASRRLIAMLITGAFAAVSIWQSHRNRPDHVRCPQWFSQACC